MIRLFFKAASDKRTAEALRSKSKKLRVALASAMDELMLALQKRIQNKLSGEVLFQRTGKLISSVIKMPTVSTAKEIRGSVTAAGGPAFYGRILEEGVPHEVVIKAVNGKALAFFPGGSAGAPGGGGYFAGRTLFFKQGARSGTLKPGSFGAFTGLGGIVVQKVVIPPQPPKPFASTSLDEMRSQITSTIFSRAAQAIRS